MSGEIFATPSLEKLVRQCDRAAQSPSLAPRGAPLGPPIPRAASISLAEMSDMFSDTGNERSVPGLLPAASLTTPAPSRRNMAAGFPVGILLYLAFVGLVAITTIGVFFGTGLFLLATPSEMPPAASAKIPPIAAPPQPARPPQEALPSNTLAPTEDGATRQATSSMATPALPVSPLAQRPAVGEAVPPQEGNSARGSVPVSPDGDASASAARGATPGGEVLALRSTSSEATIIPPAQTASAPEPEPSSQASPAPPPAPASLRVLAAEFEEFLAARRAPAADEVITFEQYRDFRIHDLTQRRARLAQQLGAPNLSEAEKKRLMRQKTYYDRLAAMPAEEGDRHFRERFDEIDANHDGKLDPEERAVWREKQREYYQQQATERAVRFHPR
jgi:hypothetical protein